MQLTGLHLLLTYQCLYQCDHCFVWSGPDQPGTMTIPNVERTLTEGLGLGTVEWVVIVVAIVLAAAVLIATMGQRVNTQLGTTAGDVADPSQLVTRFGP